MFTGIIEKMAHISGITQGPMFRRLVLPSPWEEVAIGESIAVNGCCLTIAELQPGTTTSEHGGRRAEGGPEGGAGNRAALMLHFDVISETLSKTNLGLLREGEAVHLERAMRIGDRFDGHFVQGHVDGTGPLVKSISSTAEWRLTIDCPDHLAKYLAPKGSVAVDGVSLTIASIDGNQFDVALIPTTLHRTTLGKRAAGYPFNLEMDMLSKTIVAHLERMNPR
ncbi:MAG TPA: riboflavin synthase [Tepidisphaeraceae bacterium]|jgi:riboflavin synthase